MKAPKNNQTNTAATALPARYVQPIHFEEFSGAQFERLVFAFERRLNDTLADFGLIHV